MLHSSPVCRSCPVGALPRLASQHACHAGFPWATIAQVRCYGLGSPSQSPASRAQLALLPLLLSLSNPAARILAFDPVFNSADRAVLRACGCQVLTDEEAAGFRVSERCLLYMPHCEAALYNDVLEDNWAPEHLEKLAILGNSFAAILVRRRPSHMRALWLSAFVPRILGRS